MIEEKIDKLIAYLIPERKDVSKYLVQAKRLVKKGKPPRKQPTTFLPKDWTVIGYITNSVIDY